MTPYTGKTEEFYSIIEQTNKSFTLYKDEVEKVFNMCIIIVDKITSDIGEEYIWFIEEMWEIRYILIRYGEGSKNVVD